MIVLAVMYFGDGLSVGRASNSQDHPHAREACSKCHSVNAAARSFSGPRLQNARCESCHSIDEDAGFGSDLFHQDRGQDCVACHSFHRPELVSAGGDTMLLEFAQAAAPLCETCHSHAGLRPEVSPGHFEASHLIHSQRSSIFTENPSDFCMTCHNADRATPDGSQFAEHASRFHAEASHAFGVSMESGYRKPHSTLKIQDEIPPQITLIDGKIECFTCHSLVSRHEFELVQTIQDGLCVSCHDMGDNVGPLIGTEITP